MFEPKSQWVTRAEFCRIIGRSKAWVCREAANGYFYDFGITAFVVDRGHCNRHWYFLIPPEML